MAAAGQKLVFVTGDKALDAVLAKMPAAMQKKLVRGGFRKGAKRADQEYRRIVRAEAHDTGTMEKSTKIKALKRSRTRAGISVVVDPVKLFAKYAATHDGKPPTPRKGETRPHYYPATIEFGDEHHEPVRPLRRALYENADVYRALFTADVRGFIAEQKVTTKLSKSTGGYTGKNFKK